MPLAPGAQIGPYEIVGWIGAGGMGEVYRARDPRLGRDVAIKLISQKFASDPSRVRRFEQEARAAGQINHPNILAVYDIGTHAGTSYIVSELLVGDSLATRLKTGPLPARKAIDYARQAADGLAAAHDKNLVHRDLKPDNLFITNEGRLKILDFGIAKLMLTGDDASRPTGFPTETAEGLVVGTAGYMSPEQVRGEAVDVRSDIFSFGAVFYEMLTGRPAFIRETGPETMAAILKEDPPEPLSTAAPDALVRIVTRCLEKKREARFQSARDLSFALEFLSGTTARTAAAVSASLVSTLQRWRTALIGAVVVLAIATAAAIWLPRGAGASPESDDPLPGATFTLLTNWEGTEEGAEISPDGKFVAFLSDQAGEFDIWLKQINSPNWTNLTKDFPPLAPSGFVVRKLGFTADGSEIWFNPGDGKPPMLMPMFPGARARNFLPAGTNTPAWAPDGSGVVYVDKAPGTDPMYLADPSGGNARVILGPGPMRNMNPVFSPDGEWVYFTRGSSAMDEMEMDVWRVKPVAGAPPPQQLSSQHLAINFLAPLDPRTLLYVARAEDRSGPWLWAFDVERRISRRVRAGIDQFTSVSASRDGRRIVATVANPSASLWKIPVQNRIAVDREAVPYRLTSPTGQALAPRFARASSSLFYLSSRGTGDGLWKDNGTEAIDIWRDGNGALAEPPAVSPDGNRVVVVARREGKRHLMIMDADGTRAQALAPSIEIDGAAGQGAADWSPDNTRIVTGGHDEKGPALFVITVATGAATRLLEGEWVNPIWSPKDNLILYGPRSPVLGQTELHAIRPDGAAISIPKVMTRPGGYRFLPNGTDVVYVPRILSQEFWRLDTVTGRIEQLAQLEDRGAIRTFDVTPDGKWVVFDRSRQHSNIVLIELTGPTGR
jgi:Tol biopolymer transport system component